MRTTYRRYARDQLPALVKEAEAKDVAEDAQHGADLMW